MSSIFGEDPTIIIEGRPLFSMKENVPEKPYMVPFGQAALRREGSDVTLVALGSMVPTVLQAADRLEEHGLSAEVLDLRTVVPLDEEAILRSVGKTGRLVIADPAWQSFGVSAEIGTRVAEKAFKYLKGPIARVAFPDVHSPTSVALEGLFYPDENTVIDTVKSVVAKSPALR
jgi:pyruvate dehydrogenase E1 component beta subunit